MKFLNIIFAPLFVLLLQYFEFTDVVLAYFILAIGYFGFSLVTKSTLRDMVMPIIYVLALGVAYYYSSLEMVKYIPVTLSMFFLLLFLDAHFNKKYMVLGFTNKFYKKELTTSQIEFLKRGDSYWVLVMLINTVIHLCVVNFTSDIFWAFYSSVGWYVLFFGALGAQIIYGKVRY